MNKNVLIGGLVFIGVILLAFVFNLKDESEIKPQAQQSEVVTPEAKEEVAVKTYSQDEVLEFLRGYWVISKNIKNYNDEFSYQLSFYDVSNPDLKNGNKVQGYLYSINVADNSKQTLNVLEPAGFDGTSYYFDVKEANIESYYSGGGYSSDYVFQKIRVHLKEDGIEVTLYSNTSNAGEHVFEDVKKIDLNDFSDILQSYSSGRTANGASYAIDLKNISNFNSDFGSLNVNSSGCKGANKFKFRPLSDKLILLTLGYGQAYCMNSTTVKLARGENGSLQGIVYKRGEVPFELHFEKR